jgi:hypothetical protein
MMKKIVLLSFIAALLFSCGQAPKSQENKQESPQLEASVLSIDDVLAQASELADKQVVVKGTVMHVCQEGGQRCFLMGSGEEVTIRVEAGEKIGAFKQEQMGSDLQIVGILKEVKTEADAHNIGEHSEGEAKENAEMQSAHKILAENQAAVEREFFIEGLEVKEL